MKKNAEKATFIVERLVNISNDELMDATIIEEEKKLNQHILWKFLIQELR